VIDDILLWCSGYLHNLCDKRGLILYEQDLMRSAMDWLSNCRDSLEGAGEIPDDTQDVDDKDATRELMNALYPGGWDGFCDHMAEEKRREFKKSHPDWLNSWRSGFLVKNEINEHPEV
jgi:hypothetical protein